MVQKAWRYKDTVHVGSFHFDVVFDRNSLQGSDVVFCRGKSVYVTVPSKLYDVILTET